MWAMDSVDLGLAWSIGVRDGQFALGIGMVVFVHVVCLREISTNTKRYLYNLWVLPSDDSISQ